MTSTDTIADLYLRLSDFRADDADSFPAREARLRARAADLGWTVHEPPVIENDLDGDGRRKPASAYKRQRVTGPDGRPLVRYGRPVYRVLRPGWQRILTNLGTGVTRAVLAEDLDRVARDPRDIEDLIDVVAACGGHARSLSGSLMLTDGGNSDQLAMARVMTTMAAKASADTSRRVAASRERLAGHSYQGGRRPFGYRHDPDAPKGAKTLLADEAEAAVIRQAATDILDRGISLKAVALGLRDRGVPTVTGTAWTASTLRDVLAKPAVAGLASYKGELREAPWDAILDRDVWERLRDLFDGRKTGTSPEPRWLVSCYATCGVCGAPVKCTGSASRRAYTCTAHGHVRRAAEAVDRHVAAVAVERLSRPDAAGLLLPPPRPGTDAAALRGKARRLRSRREQFRKLGEDGDMAPADVAATLRGIDAKLDAIGAQLAASDAPDPLAEFRGRPAAEVWQSLSLPRRRAVVRLLMAVAILPARRKGAAFDPAALAITPLA
jgi:DNA invertase Pin-like site-specific DNA recombinase